MSANLTSSKPTSHAALGFRVHSGWTALVALSVDEDGPRVLARGRPELVETFTYEFRQPYHTAQKMPLDKARAFIAGVKAEANRMALGAIRTVQADQGKQGYEITCFGLIRSSAKPLPTLDRILASHALIHTADGELFREALAHASGQCHLAEFSIKESELVNSACETLSLGPKDLLARLGAMGKLVGPPWSQDEKFAALTAWIALCSRGGSSKG